MALAEIARDWHDPWRTRASLYRGPDRRVVSARPAGARSSARPFGAFLVASHLVVAATVVLGSWSATGRPGPTSWLTPSVAVISALAGAIHVLRWRLAGDAAALWVSAALFVYSAANIAFPDLLRSLADGTGAEESVAALLRPVSVFVVMVLLVLAATARTVDVGLSIRRVIVVGGAATAVGFVLSSLSSDFRLLLGPAIDRIPAHGGAFGQVGVAVLWLSLALVFVWKASRDWCGSHAWLALLLFGLAEARLALALSVGGDPAWMLASQVCRLLGVAAALAGAVHELERSFVRQRSTLFSSLAELGSTRERREAELASAEERAHDLRAALTGIGSAALTLERYHDQLTDDERAGLAKSVSAEISRLQHIVAEVRAEPVPFALGKILDPVVACATSSGARIDVDVPADLAAVGRPAEVAEAFQNLLDNARCHAPGSPVNVHAERIRDRVVLRVEDRGPGVPRTDHTRVFERGYRGSERRGGSGLGLYVTARLVRDQEGDLRVEDRAGGGASFVVTLPAACEGDGRT